MRRIGKDRADTVLEPFNLRKYLAAGLDIHIWAFGFIYYSSTTTAYAISYFLPTIYAQGMGFSEGVSLCLFAPPFAAAGVLMYVTSWAGDRYHIRGPILIFNALITIIGLPLLVRLCPRFTSRVETNPRQGFTEGNASRMVGAFLTTMGCNSNIPAAMAYQVSSSSHIKISRYADCFIKANNIRGQWKRAFASAIFVGLGASGGMTGSLVFRSQDAPNYHPGILTCLGLSCLTIVLVILLSIRFYYANRKVDRGELIIGKLAGFKYTY